MDKSRTDKYEVNNASCELTVYDHKELSEFNVKWLSNLYVDKDNRGKGEAKALLKQLGKDADLTQTAILLEPKGYEEGIDQDRLESLYKQFGFIIVQDEPKLMLRVPVNPMLMESLKRKKTSSIITEIYR